MALIHRPTGCTLGMLIRALRMGFCHLPEHGGFMRLTTVDAQRMIFRCDLHPFELIPNSFKNGEEHCLWWRGDDREGLDVNRIDGIRHLIRVKRPYSFYFDENGRTI